MSKAPRTNFVPGKNRTNIGEMKKWTDTVTQTCILTCHGRSQYIQQDIKGVAMHSKMFSKVGNSSVGVVNLKARLVRSWKAAGVWIVSASPVCLLHCGIPRVIT